MMVNSIPSSSRVKPLFFSCLSCFDRDFMHPKSLLIVVCVVFHFTGIIIVCLPVYKHQRVNIIPLSLPRDT